MANHRTLHRLIGLSRAGSLALAIAAVAVAVPVPTKHQVRASETADKLMALALGLQTVAWLFLLGMVYIERIGLVGGPPGNAVVVVLAVGEWVLACFTSGTACAGLAVAQTTVSRGACAPTACAMYLSVAMMACLAGALGAFSALGTLWLVAPRFRQQPQAA